MRRRARTACTLPVAAGVVDVSALIASGAISFDPATSNGGQQTINWHYDPAAADLDWLRAGDTLTLTYVAQVNDGHGNVGAQNLVITITGTNDVPTIGTTTNPASIAELLRRLGAGHPAGQRHDRDHRPGSRRHPDALRHRQCDGELHAEWRRCRRAAGGRWRRRRFSADRLGRHQLRSGHLQWRAADHQLALRPGRRRPRLAAGGRHADAHLCGPGQ